MKLIHRLKAEYKTKISKDVIKILSDYEYIGDIKISDAQIVVYNLTGSNIQLGLLMDLFYSMKDIYNNYLIEPYNQTGFPFKATNLVQDEVTILFGKTIEEIKEQIDNL